MNILKFRYLLLQLLLGILWSSTLAESAKVNDSCDIPAHLRLALTKNCSASTLVHLNDLSDYDRDLYVKDHGARCPGLTRVDFYGDGKPTLALILISAQDPKQKFRLVIAHYIEDTWRLRSLDVSDGPAPVVWQDKPGKYDDVYGEKTIRASYQVDVFCGYGSWAVVYSWNGRSTDKVWLSD